MDDLKNDLEVIREDFQFQLESRVLVPATCHEYSKMGST